MSAPIASPSHHARQVVKRSGVETIPLARRLATPIVALTSAVSNSTGSYNRLWKDRA